MGTSPHDAWPSKVICALGGEPGNEAIWKGSLPYPFCASGHISIWLLGRPTHSTPAMSLKSREESILAHSKETNAMDVKEEFTHFVCGHVKRVAV